MRTPYKNARQQVALSLEKQAAATLSEAIGAGETLSDFCRQVLETLAERIDHYWQRFEELLPNATDVPADLESTVRQLANLWDLGQQLAAYCPPEWLRVGEVFTRVRQLGILAEGFDLGGQLADEITDEGEIEVPVPVIWTPEDWGGGQ